MAFLVWSLFFVPVHRYSSAATQKETPEQENTLWRYCNLNYIEQKDPLKTIPVFTGGMGRKFLYTQHDWPSIKLISNFINLSRGCSSTLSSSGLFQPLSGDQFVALTASPP